MGRRYYCDYCDKSFVETSDAVKKHRKSLLHQKLMKEHYNTCKDPETVLKEECAKNPCNRFHNTGDCPFGSTCRYTHYTKEQLDTLRWQVNQKSGENINPTIESWFHSRRQRNLQDSNGLNLFFSHSLPMCNTRSNHDAPWTYPEIFNNYSWDIPPSLRRIHPEDLANVDFKTWG